MRAEIEFSEELWEKIRKMADIKGITVDTLIGKTMEEQMNLFRDQDGNITPISAFLKEYKYNDEERELVEKLKECVVLKATKMFGQDFYKIYIPKEDKLQSVPKSEIIIKED